MSQREHASGDGSFARDAGTQTGRAVILIVVAVLVAVLVLRHSGPTSTAAAPLTTTTTSTTIAKTTTTTPAVATTTTTIPVSQVKVQVLNAASPTLPLAGELTAKLVAKGYPTVTANNATSSGVATSAIYVLVAADAPAAAALAASLGLPASAVKTTIPASAPIPASTKVLAPDLVLVVGADLVSKA